MRRMQTACLLACVREREKSEQRTLTGKDGTTLSLSLLSYAAPAAPAVAAAAVCLLAPLAGRKLNSGNCLLLSSLSSPLVVRSRDSHSRESAAAAADARQQQQQQRRHAHTALFLHPPSMQVQAGAATAATPADAEANEKREVACPLFCCSFLRESISVCIMYLSLPACLPLLRQLSAAVRRQRRKLIVRCCNASLVFPV